MVRPTVRDVTADGDGYIIDGPSAAASSSAATNSREKALFEPDRGELIVTQEWISRRGCNPA